jgi:hypothetical protein
MAFQQNSLYIDRGTYNGDKSPDQLAEHSYRTSVDTLAEVSVISFDNPYFPPYLTTNPQDEQVQIGDLVEVSASDAYGRFKVIALNPFAMVQNNDIDPDPDFNNITTNTITFAETSVPPGPSPLSFYAENVIIPLTFSGAFGTPVDTAAIVTRIGSMVIMNISEFSGVSTNELTLTAEIPSWLQLSAGALTKVTAYTDGFLDSYYSPYMARAEIIPESTIISISILNATPVGNFPVTSDTLTVHPINFCYCVN